MLAKLRRWAGFFTRAGANVAAQPADEFTTLPDVRRAAGAARPPAAKDLRRILPTWVLTVVSATTMAEAISGSCAPPAMRLKDLLFTRRQVARGARRRRGQRGLPEVRQGLTGHDARHRQGAVAMEIAQGAHEVLARAVNRAKPQLNVCATETVGSQPPLNHVVESLHNCPHRTAYHRILQRLEQALVSRAHPQWAREGCKPSNWE
jgi:hypothetical protein